MKCNISAQVVKFMYIFNEINTSHFVDYKQKIEDAFCVPDQTNY